ncbi:MAG: hypothetical protein E6J75_07855 [Deltaproteobacteria bacterium]|nr:MAG: hypothetical protein E6J75_07855 [Deltaproteobacteria bacterium]
MMAAPFRLARVLGLRTRLRERAQEETRAAAAAVAAARARVDAARAAQVSVRGAEQAAAASGLTGADLARFRTYERGMIIAEAALVEDGARCAEDLDRCRAALVDRRREERQLERLRVRAEERHRAVEERAAAVLLDDLARR